MVGTYSRSRSRSRSRERLDRFGRVIPRGTKSRSRSRSRSGSRSTRRRRRSRTPSYRSRRPHRSRSRSRSGSRSRQRPYTSRTTRNHEEVITNRTNIEDPQFLNARLFIGSLPSDKVTKEEFEDLFKGYGKILGVSIHDKGYGFIQFEKEEDAIKAREGENGTKLKGSVLTVKMAAEGRRGGNGRDRPPGGRGRDFDNESVSSVGGYRDDRDAGRGAVDPYEDRYRDPYARRELPPRDDPYRRGPPPPVDVPYRRGPPPPPSIDDPYRDPYREDPYRRDPYRRDPYDDPHREPYRDAYRDPYLPPPPKKTYPADVQIVCMTKTLMLYAESLEARLRQNAMIVDIVVIPEDLTVPQMVEEASNLKNLFAIIINSQNEIHKSLTLNILHGTPQEHRNMPLEDAIKLIGTSFEKYIQTQREKAAPTGVTTPAVAAPAVAKTVPFIPPAADVAYLLNLLADNRQLTIEEIEKVVGYLTERRDKLLLAEGRQPTESQPKPTGVQPPAAPSSATTTLLQQQQQDLQNKILNILNGSGSTAQSTQQPTIQAQSPLTGVSSLVSATHALQGQVHQTSAVPAASPLINFDNPNVQKALDNLIQSGPNLLKSLPSSVSPQAPARQSNYLAGSQQQVQTRPVQQAPRPPQQGLPQSVNQGAYIQPQRFPQQGAGRGAPVYGNQPRPYFGNRAPQQGIRPRY